VGYYTHVLGLGLSPDNVVFSGAKGVYSEEGDYYFADGALDSFWRAAEVRSAVARPHCCTALHCTALHHSSSHCTTPRRTAPLLVALHHSSSHCTTLTALHGTALYHALHCTALHCTALHHHTL
jgi:hypothetical protein